MAGGTLRLQEGADEEDMAPRGTPVWARLRKKGLCPFLFIERKDYDMR